MQLFGTILSGGLIHNLMLTRHLMQEQHIRLFTPRPQMHQIIRMDTGPELQCKKKKKKVFEGRFHIHSINNPTCSLTDCFTETHSILLLYVLLQMTTWGCSLIDDQTEDSQ